jgi:hypothetical protein
VQQPGIIDLMLLRSDSIPSADNDDTSNTLSITDANTKGDFLQALVLLSSCISWATTSLRFSNSVVTCFTDSTRRGARRE